MGSLRLQGTVCYGAANHESAFLNPSRSGQRYARWREVTVRGERGRPPGTAARAILGLASPLGAAGEPILVDPHDVRRRDLLGALIHEYHGAAA